MKALVYGVCDGCAETIQGIVDRDGDFISDKELERPARLRAAGCYLCGCPTVGPGASGEWEPVHEYEEE